MLVLSVLNDFFNQCSRLLKTAGGLQNPTRTALITDLQGICDRCESAYGKLITQLAPIKSAYYDRAQLVSAIRGFVQNAEVRNNFKPRELCHEALLLLDRLANNLDPLKYSIDVRKVGELKATLTQFGDYDLAFFDTFDAFATDLDRLASDIADPSLPEAALAERMAYARTVIENFEDQISETVHSAQRALQRLAP